MATTAMQIIAKKILCFIDEPMREPAENTGVDRIFSMAKSSSLATVACALTTDSVPPPRSRDLRFSGIEFRITGD
jgi:hypothetical protein